jgi:ribA/ribD-fused uncharacterized protein
LAHTPRDAKKLGRSNDYPLRADWDEAKENEMRRALHAKFSIHVDARDLLLSTGDEELIENSPEDFYWAPDKMEADAIVWACC